MCAPARAPPEVSVYAYFCTSQASKMTPCVCVYICLRAACRGQTTTETASLRTRPGGPAAPARVRRTPRQAPCALSQKFSQCCRDRVLVSACAPYPAPSSRELCQAAKHAVHKAAYTSSLRPHTPSSLRPNLPVKAANTRRMSASWQRSVSDTPPASCPAKSSATASTSAFRRVSVCPFVPVKYQ